MSCPPKSQILSVAELPGADSGAAPIFHAMRRRNSLVVLLALQAAANLRLAHPPIAQQHELEVDDFAFAALQVSEVRAQFF